MSLIRLGYGSEWHMLRFLGRHRRAFSEDVLAKTGAQSVDWLDFNFTSGITPRQNYGDAEIKGLDFLTPGDPARLAWSTWWPQTGNVQNWDAVGKLHYNESQEWLLVEAKANVQELLSATQAKAHGGLPLIKQRLLQTQQACGIATQPDWTKPYYQYANRLALLHFLDRQGIRARLLFVYFTGDSTPGRLCPANQQQWQAPLLAMKSHLHLNGSSLLESRTHQLFLKVCP